MDGQSRMDNPEIDWLIIA